MKIIIDVRNKYDTDGKFLGTEVKKAEISFFSTGNAYLECVGNWEPMENVIYPKIEIVEIFQKDNDDRA